MVKFSFLMAMLLNVQGVFMKASDRIISIDEHLFDLALHHDPLLDHTIVYALSLVNKNLSVIAAVTKDVRRTALEDAIVKKRYSIFQDDYNSEKKKYDLDRRSLYFYAHSSLAVALVVLNKKSQGVHFKQYDFHCVYAYAENDDIKIVASSKMIMHAGTGNGIRMGCDRGIPFLHMGFSDMGQIINGPFVNLGENHRSISVLYRGNPCNTKGDMHEYTFAGDVGKSHRETVDPISNIEKYIEDRCRPKIKEG